MSQTTRKRASSFFQVPRYSSRYYSSRYSLAHNSEREGKRERRRERERARAKCLPALSEEEKAGDHNDNKKQQQKNEAHIRKREKKKLRKKERKADRFCCGDPTPSATKAMKKRNGRQRSKARPSPPPPSRSKAAAALGEDARPHATNGSSSDSSSSSSSSLGSDIGFAGLCAVVFAVAVGVHWHIVDHAHDWVYDDGSVVEDNPMLKGNPETGQPEQPLSQLLYTDYWGTPMTEDRLSHLSFRPFTSLTFRLQVHCLCSVSE